MCVTSIFLENEKIKKIAKRNREMKIDKRVCVRKQWEGNQDGSNKRFSIPKLWNEVYSEKDVYSDSIIELGSISMNGSCTWMLQQLRKEK